MPYSARLDLLLMAAQPIPVPGEEETTTREQRIRAEIEIISSFSDVNEPEYGDKTLLHSAFELLDDLYAVIHELLDAGASSSISGEDQITPLMTAAALQYHERGILEKLTKRAAEDGGVDKADPSGRTSLHKAAHRGNADVVRMLLAAGASPDLRDDCGITPLMLAVSCKKTSNEQRIAMTRQLLAAGADVNAANTYGLTSLVYACKHTERETAELLLSHGALLTTVGKFISAGMNILLCALIGGTIEMVRWLVEAGADVNFVGETERAGPSSALKVAIVRVNKRREDLDIVRYLLERGADPNLTNAIEGNILSHDIVRKSPHQDLIIKLLLDNEADMYAVGVRDTKSPLETYVSEGKLSVVRLFLENGLELARYNPRMPNDFSPLHMAISLDNGSEMLKLLLEHNTKGSLNLDHEDNDGFSPLSAALQKKSLECVKLLLKAGARVNHVNSKGSSALELILSSDQSKFKLAAIELLVEAGANVDKTTRQLLPYSSDETKNERQLLPQP